MVDSLHAVDLAIRHRRLVLALVILTALSCWRAGLEQSPAAPPAAIHASPSSSPIPHR